MLKDQRLAFEVFYAEHAQPIYRFALRLCGNPDEAEDLASEALVKAFRKLAGYRGDASPRTWLCSIVINQWRMLRRRREVPQTTLLEAEHIASTFEFRDLDLANAIASLSDPMREAFLLVKGEGLTHAEAAAIARVPVGTMYFRVHSATKQLREKLTSNEIACEVKSHHEV